VSIAKEIAEKLTDRDIAAISTLSSGGDIDKKLVKRLKELGIHDSKSKRKITLYGSYVIKYLKEYGRWPD
jgi:hypothetical protein